MCRRCDMASVTVEHFSLGHYDTYFRASYGSGYEYQSWASGSDSAGKWNIYLAYRVYASKTVNYVIFEVATRNRVNDDVYDEITKNTRQRLKATGPFSSNKLETNCWNLCYYSGDLYVAFGNATLYYSDGTTETVSINLLDKRDNADYFRHNENEQGYAKSISGYKPKEYKEQDSSFGIKLVLGIVGIMILLIITGALK